MNGDNLSSKLNEDTNPFPVTMMDYEENSNTSSAFTEVSSSHTKSSLSQPPTTTLKQLPLDNSVTFTADDSNSLMSENDTNPLPTTTTSLENRSLASLIDEVNNSIGHKEKSTTSRKMTKEQKSDSTSGSLSRQQSSSMLMANNHRNFNNDENHENIEQMFEYLYPPTNSTIIDESTKPQEWFMIQEVVSEFLQVKSFKRKYPDILRRSVDGFEKDWLLTQKLVTTNQAELGLTALRSEDVLNLLAKDYPQVHEAVAHLLHSRRVENLRIQQKEQYESARLERSSAKLLQSRQKALKSAQEFNRRLLTERIRERRYYWDLQTQQIHVSRPRVLKSSIRPHRLLQRENESSSSYSTSSATNTTTINSTNCPSFSSCTTPSCAYPVALLPGQFSHYYRRYSSQEMFYLPLNTAIYAPPRNEIQWMQPVPNQPPQQVVSTKDEAATSVDGRSTTIGQDDDSFQPSIITTTPSRPVTCTVCHQLAVNHVKCTDCKRQGHPTCLDLPEDMLDVVKTYPWSCMECKRCVECSDPGHEEAMLFCDRCDRGYHMFCVGLKAIPKGQWQCAICTHKHPRRVVITTGE